MGPISSDYQRVFYALEKPHLTFPGDIEEEHWREMS